MSTAFHPQIEGRKERMDGSIAQYLRVFVNYQQEHMVKWLVMAEFAANNAASEMTKCTLSNAMQGKDSRMTYTSERAEGHDHWQFDADLVQSTMEQIYEHLHVNI